MHIKNNTHMTTISKLAVAATLVIFIQIDLIGNAHALTRFNNCITRDANNHGTLSLADVENCYDTVFKGAENADDDGRPLS